MQETCKISLWRIELIVLLQFDNLKRIVTHVIELKNEGRLGDTSLAAVIQREFSLPQDLAE
jgi:hypothetical protein